ncbi:MAG: gliding motility-associated C-terminal domain-containing protein [Lewinellaceae bacterium]|nr:gliding motility-associated C-terminal domain-containing protein [Lewinellaceae bacterium]
MKKILIPITGLVLSALGVLAQPTLIEDFESGNLNNWTIQDGQPQVVSDQVYSGTQSLLMAVSPDGPTLLTHNSFSGAYGRYRVYFFCEGPFPDFNFYFQYQGAADFYQVSCKPEGTDNPELSLIRKEAGLEEVLAQGGASFTTGAWNELVVERACDQTIRVFINGAEQFSVVDAAFQLPGKVALGAWAETVYADELGFEPFSASVQILGDTTFCYDPTMLEASGTFPQYLWSTGSKQKSVGIADPGTVWLQVTDENGCQAVDSVKVLTFCPTRFYTPNIFSPNFDGVNDLFQIFPEKQVSLFNLKVFTRWGELVFETKDIGQGWDGTFRGRIAPPDLYLWVAQLDEFNLSGNVVLIR